MSRSSPTKALPVARIRFSPLSVRGSSVVPVCRPFSDHSVSPCRMMKARGVVIGGSGGDQSGIELRGEQEEIIRSSGEGSLRNSRSTVSINKVLNHPGAQSLLSKKFN